MENAVVGSQTLTTEYAYDPNTDRLLIESNTGPKWAVLMDDGPMYAYANNDGIVYKGGNGRIGELKAFFLGLPTRISQRVLAIILIITPIAFFMPVIVVLMIRLRRNTLQKAKPRLSLFYRCLSVMLAYMMLISPACLQSLAEGADQYSELDSRHWAEGDTTIEYDYDDNGSLVSKITKATGIEVERTIYEYNLQNRLNTVKTSFDGGTNWDSITEYKYDPDGNRVQKTVDGVTTSYLIDSLNHTGYSQVFVEDGGTYQTTYIIGDDVLTQATGTGQTDIQYLLYDGHNSTRQLADSTGNLITNESYSYDAYGVMLGGNPASPVGTNLLYSGEWFDTKAQHYYLRERWYDPLNGRFSSIDPFVGNHQDPQSLHKYLYVHNNPINSIDPTGMMEFSLSGLLITSVIAGLISSVIAGEVVRIRGGATQQIIDAQWRWFWRGFIASAAAYSIAWTIHSIWLWLYGGSQMASNPEFQTQLHHFASNKHSYWTPQYEDIISKYGLKLNEAWNLNPFSTQYHSGPHPEAYHQWVFEQMTQAAHQAGASAIRFIILFQEYIVTPVMENPEMLRSKFWTTGG